MKLINKIKKLFRKNITYTPLNGICKWEICLIDDEEGYDYYSFVPSCSVDYHDDNYTFSAPIYKSYMDYKSNKLSSNDLLNKLNSWMKIRGCRFCERCGGEIIIYVDGKSLVRTKTINTKHLTLN